MFLAHAEVPRTHGKEPRHLERATDRDATLEAMFRAGIEAALRPHVPQQPEIDDIASSAFQAFRASRVARGLGLEPRPVTNLIIQRLFTTALKNIAEDVRPTVAACIFWNEGALETQGASDEALGSALYRVLKVVGAEISRIKKVAAKDPAVRELGNSRRAAAVNQAIILHLRRTFLEQSEA